MPRSSTNMPIGAAKALPAIERVPFFLLAVLLTSAAVWLIYGCALGSPLIYDDRLSIRENPSILRLWPLVGDAQQRGPLNPPKDLPTSGRPLVNLSLALNYHCRGLDPLGYHVFNLIVHLFSALLLMAIVRRTLQLEYFGGRFDGIAGWMGLATAVLWAVHPLQTETVIYTTQRTELLVGFFYLATMYGSLRYWGAASALAQNTWIAITTLTCLAGMASKEVMVTAPVVVLLFERTFIAGSFRKALRRSWRLYVGLALGWGLLLALNINSPRSNTAGFHLQVPAYAWWFTQCKVLWMYLKLVVWPWPLAIHYEMPYLTTVSAALPWLLLTALLGIGIFYLVWRRSSAGFLGAWMLVILSPTLIVPIVTEVAVERRMYLPLAALAALAVVGGYELAQQLAAQRAKMAGSAEAARLPLSIAAATAIVVAIALGAVSMWRLAVYLDPIRLWEDNLVSQPDDPIAHNNLGTELMKANHVQDAIEHYRSALRLQSQYAMAHNNLGAALLQAGEPQEAVEQEQQALAIKPEYADARGNLANALLQMGRRAEAIEQYQQALKIDPDSVKAHYDLGNALAGNGQLQEATQQYRRVLQLDPRYADAYNNLGVVLGRLGQRAEAVALYRLALQQNPASAEAQCNLGKALAANGQMPEALEHFQQALRLKPDFPEGHNDLATALLNAGRVAKALEHYRRAIKLRPDYAEAHTNLGLALANAGQLPEAIEQFQEVLRLKPNSIEAHINLMIGYAHAQRRSDAIATAKKALELANSTGESEAAGEIEKWLANYVGDQGKSMDRAAPSGSSGAAP